MCPKRCVLYSVDKPLEMADIVLDINGILCHCMEKAATRKMLFVNDVKQGIHSPTIQNLGRKGVVSCKNK